jgi:hypothetical protein
MCPWTLPKIALPQKPSSITRAQCLAFFIAYYKIWQKKLNRDSEFTKIKMKQPL